MTQSDWIAISVALTSLVIAVSGFVVNYLINRQNIKARRAEIATIKSIEAFREIVEQITRFHFLVDKADHYAEKGFTPPNGDLNEIYNNLINNLGKNRIYFPQKIYNALLDYLIHLNFSRSDRPGGGERDKKQILNTS